MVSNIIGFLLISLTVIFFSLLAKPLKKLFSVRQLKPIHLTRALDRLFIRPGRSKYSSKHLEHFLLINFMWINLGAFTFLTSQLDFVQQDILLLVAPTTGISLALWWAWRKGILL